MKIKLLAIATLALVAGCGIFSTKAPCPGVWCIDVSTIPGPALCYLTQADMLAAKQAFEAKGATVAVRK